MNELIQRLERIETQLELLLNQHQVQEWYDTSTIAEILGKAPWTVREWCRLGRIFAEKRRSGRGSSKEWMISH